MQGQHIAGSRHYIWLLEEELANCDDLEGEVLHEVLPHTAPTFDEHYTSPVNQYERSVRYTKQCPSSST